MTQPKFPGQPPQPTTKTLPAVSIPLDTAQTLLSEIRKVGVDVAVLREDQQAGNQRMTLMEQSISRFEQRADASSIRVRQESRTNLQQDAALATVIMEQNKARERDEATQRLIAQNTAITSEVKTSVLGAFKHPAIQALALAVIGFITAWLARHT
jgi:hypothetical protein